MKQRFITYYALHIFSKFNLSACFIQFICILVSITALCQRATEQSETYFEAI